MVKSGSCAIFWENCTNLDFFVLGLGYYSELFGLLRWTSSQNGKCFSWNCWRGYVLHNWKGIHYLMIMIIMIMINDNNYDYICREKILSRLFRFILYYYLGTISWVKDDGRWENNELTLEQLMKEKTKNYNEATYNQLTDALKMYSTDTQSKTNIFKAQDVERS